jgi:site-specific recombinase XerD
MTFAKNPSGERTDEARWPWCHRQTFLERLGAQGYAPSTIHEYRKIAGRFCEAIEKRAIHFSDKLGDLNAITPDDIVAFVSKLKAASLPRRYKSLPSHLSNLFKPLFRSGKTRRNLANGLPRVAQTNPDNLPRYLNPEEIRRLIEAVRTTPPGGRTTRCYCSWRGWDFALPRSSRSSSMTSTGTPTRY